MDEDNFIITDVNFSNILYDDLLEEYSNLSSAIERKKKKSIEEKHKKEKSIIQKMHLLDTVRKFAAEDLSDYGSVSIEINRNLWKKNKIEKFFSLEVNLQYIVRSEYDYDVTYVYKTIKTW